MPACRSKSRSPASRWVWLRNEDMSKWEVLTDIQDLEDGQGGMDFKITGTPDGITAIQLDTKTDGLIRTRS